MKKAIGYIRISTKDQSRFSLDAQGDYVRQYAAQQGWHLLDVYRDDGQSAKNFDRVNWKELEQYLHRNHEQVDYLIVPKYDRFSRNVKDALDMIERLEYEYKIAVVSVMEPIGVEPDNPSFFFTRMQMLTFAEFELRTIRQRTKVGQRRAALSGRWVSGAPYGYKNARDKGGHPILEIDTERAIVVRKIYELYLSGMQMSDVGKEARKLGFTLKGNSAVERVLKNPLYTGLVVVPPMNDEPEQLVKALHEPIIDRGVWERVQQKIGKPARNRTVIREEVPLRGELKCHCGKHLTAAPSRGKAGKQYWYYFCPDHRKANLSAKKLHRQFEALCGELSLPPEYLSYLKRKVEVQLEQAEVDRLGEARLLRQQVAELQGKLRKLDEKYVLDAIDGTAYQRMKTQWGKELKQVEDHVQRISFPEDGILSRHEKHLHKLGDISALFEAADVHQKQSLIRVVFDGKLYYENGVYRTPSILPVFSCKLRQLKEKGLLYLEQPLTSRENSHSYHVRELNRTQDSKASPTLVDFLDLAMLIKTG